MTNAEILLEEIGSTDETLIPVVSEKRANKRILTWAAAVAVAAAALALVLCWPGLVGTNTGNPSQTAANDSTEAVALERMDVTIYIAGNGSLSEETVTLDATAEEVFNAWKAKNGIGNDVRLLKSELSDNGKEGTDGSVAWHTAGGKLTLTLTVTDTLRNYYDRIPEQWLLESLERTMIGYSHAEIAEYVLVLQSE